MNEYLVVYQPYQTHKCFPSIHIWPEILSMLKVRDETKKGSFAVYLFSSTGEPKVCRIVHCRNVYWLEDKYGNVLEGRG